MEFETTEEAIQELNLLSAKLDTLSNPIKIKIIKRQIRQIKKYLKE